MGNRAHRCPACGKNFRSALALGQHATDKHGAPAPARPLKIEPVHVEPRCIECGDLAKLVGGERIYPHRPDLYAKNFYLCRCGAYCGCHGFTTRPLGFPCGPETRKARSAAHAAFDPLWQRGSMSRRDAYAWLAGSLKINFDDCHIGMMDAPTTRRVVELVNTRTKAAA